MKLGLDNSPWWGQIALYALLAAGAAGGYYYFFHVDLEAELARQQQQLQTLQAEVTRAQAQERRLPEFRAEVADLEQRLTALKAVLPEQKDVGELLRRIQTLATQSSLTIRGFKPQAVSVKQQHAEWPISLQLEGGYHDLGAFFDKVSRLPRIINITGIDIKAQGAREAVETASTVQANCTVTTFVLSDPAAPPAPGGRAARPGAAGVRPPAAAR
jgi:type IV pilus assembly protein PilO